MNHKRKETKLFHRKIENLRRRINSTITFQDRFFKITLFNILTSAPNKPIHTRQESTKSTNKRLYPIE